MHFHHSSKIKSSQRSKKNSKNQGFYLVFYSLMEGSRSGSVQINYWSGCGSRRLKNIQIRILILGMVWYGMVWYGMVRYGMVWYGTVWYGMVWYGMVWYGMVWYGMVWLPGGWRGDAAQWNACHTADRRGAWKIIKILLENLKKILSRSWSALEINAKLHGNFQRLNKTCSVLSCCCFFILKVLVTPSNSGSRSW